MRRYAKEMKEVQSVRETVCNKCGKEIAMKNGKLLEGCFHVEYPWGYFSGKDGEVHTFDLCEDCYDEMISGFYLPVEIEG